MHALYGTAHDPQADPHATDGLPDEGHSHVTGIYCRLYAYRVRIALPAKLTCTIDRKWAKHLNWWDMPW
jgi:hypothetical protein